MHEPQNVFANLQSDLPDELIEMLVQSQQTRIERIVSHGHASPEGFWYDQEIDEWVLLLSGAARLRFEGEDVIEMSTMTRSSQWNHESIISKPKVEKYVVPTTGQPCNASSAMPHSLRMCSR